MQFRVFLALIICVTFFPSSMPVLAKARDLENLEWLNSARQRELLKIITICALREDQLLVTEQDGFLFEFYGKYGAAPKWDGYPSSISARQQRLVSACVLARVNYYPNRSADIQLRTPATSKFQIELSEEDKQGYPFYEGSYFGNIFLFPQKKYVCQGTAPLRVLMGKNRICSIPSLEESTETKISACGFTIVGKCEDPDVFSRDSINYEDVIQVWVELH